MTDTEYVIRGGREGRERLRVLARVMQPTTRALLERAGVRPGMACLDVGCGGGDGSLELARLVGRKGRVVGVDRDASAVALARAEAAALEFPHVEFRVGAADALAGAAEFDIVYCRFILTHLSDPGAVLATLRTRLRPGGCAIVEDIDFRGHFAHPDHPAFSRYLALYTQVVQRRGADPNIGPRLPALLLDAGYARVGVHVVQPAGIDGEVKSIAPLTMASIAEPLLADGLATRAEIDALVADLEAFAADPRTLIGLPRIVQAWGVRADGVTR